MLGAIRFCGMVDATFWMRSVQQLRSLAMSLALLLELGLLDAGNVKEQGHSLELYFVRLEIYS